MGVVNSESWTEIWERDIYVHFLDTNSNYNQVSYKCCYKNMNKEY
jgi:hypothetical protein